MEHAASGLRAMLLRAMRAAPPGSRMELAWQMVAGPAVAGHARFVECREGVLTVRVPDEGWATQLAALAPDYLRELRALLAEEPVEGRTKIERIAFVKG